MLLAIDIGNTNIVCGLFDGDALAKTWRQKTSETFLCDEENIEAVIVCSVVPAKNQEITDAFDVPVTFVTNENAGIDIKIDKPEEVGADRLVNAMAAREEFGSPAIIVDFGTATTFDVVDPQGHYAGGMIAPGINLSLKALGEAAAQLPTLKIEKPNTTIGKNTVDAMQSGIYWGYIGLIEGNIHRIQKQIRADCTIIATGGLAPLFAEGTDVLTNTEADLTLKGLLHIYKSIKP